MNFLKNVLNNYHVEEPATNRKEKNGTLAERTQCVSEEENGEGKVTVDLQTLLNDVHGRTTPTESALIEELAKSDGDSRERLCKILLLERHLRSRPDYAILFHDDERRGSRTDDPHLRLDLLFIHRVLKAKKFNDSEAKKYISDWIDWRLKERPHKIQLDDIWQEYVTGKAYWSGRDRNGLPICVMRPQYHDPLKRDYEQCRRFGIWVAERGLSILHKHRKDKCVVMYDASKVTLKSLDIPMFQALFQVFTMYPEFLEYAIVVPSFSFWVLWKLGSPFMDQSTKTKIRFVESRSDLLELVDSEHQIMEPDFGGNTTNSDYFEHVEQMDKTCRTRTSNHNENTSGDNMPPSSD